MNNLKVVNDAAWKISLFGNFKIQKYYLLHVMKNNYPGQNDLHWVNGYGEKS